MLRGWSSQWTCLSPKFKYYLFTAYISGQICFSNSPPFITISTMYLKHFASKIIFHCYFLVWLGERFCKWVPASMYVSRKYPDCSWRSLEMIRCKCGTDKLCSRKIGSCSNICNFFDGNTVFAIAVLCRICNFLDDIQMSIVKNFGVKSIKSKLIEIEF